MKYSIFSNLHTRLFFLVLIITIPSVVLSLGAGLEQRLQSGNAVKEEALRMTRMINAYHGQWIDRSHQIVYALTTISAVKEHDTETCNRILTRLINQYPSYTDFAAALPDGTLFCGSTPEIVNEKNVNVSDRDWFNRSIETRGFVLSDIVISRLSGRQTLTFASPVYDDDDQNELLAVVVAGLDVEVLINFAASAELPTDSIITLIDSNGHILARYPEEIVPNNTEVINTPLISAILSEKSTGTTELVDMDGISRLYAFAPMESGLPGEQMYVTVGIPSTVAFGKADSSMIRNGVILIFLTLLAFGAAIVIGNFFILKPIEIVSKGTKHLTAGELSTRITTNQGVKEFDQLSQSFNEMAESLYKNTTELNLAQQQFRELVEQVPSVIYTYDFEQNKVKYISPRIEELIGIASETFQTQPNMWQQFIHPDDREKVAQTLLQGFQTAQSMTIEYRMLHTDGHVVWVSNQAAVIYNETHNTAGLLQGTLSDITQRKEAEEIVKSQSEMMRELSTPLLQIDDRVMLMPLVGAMDSQRMHQMMYTLLKGVEENRVKTVILDVTGVAVIDSQVANAMIQTEQAIRLLGARVILTGIRPEVAQALVGLGIDLGTLESHSTLQTGIAYTLHQGHKHIKR